MSEDELLILEMLEKTSAPRNKIHKQFRMLAWSYPEGRATLHGRGRPKKPPDLLPMFAHVQGVLENALQRWYNDTVTLRVVGAIGEEFRDVPFKSATISLPTHLCKLIKAIGREEPSSFIWASSYVDDDMFLGMRLVIHPDEYSLVVGRVVIPRGRPK